MPYDNSFLGYVGGIMDGEGSISICKTHRNRSSNKNPSYNVRISVSMCDKEIPWLLFQTFGGSFQERQRKNEKYKPSYDWIISNKNSIYFLETIFPYIKINRKLETAKLCLEFQTHISDKNIKGKRLSDEELNYRENCYVQSKQLNHRGLIGGY